MWGKGCDYDKVCSWRGDSGRCEGNGGIHGHQGEAARVGRDSGGNEEFFFFIPMAEFGMVVAVIVMFPFFLEGMMAVSSFSMRE